MTNYRRGVFAPRYGNISLRIGQKFWFLKAPWNTPLFSERNGYKTKVFVSLFGFRFGYKELD